MSAPSSSFKPTPPPTLKSMENDSPAGDFVAVFTPTDQSRHPGNENVDINGIKVGDWAGELHERDMRSSYFWSVCCCPCIPVAQLEVRMGRSSYGHALLSHGLTYTIMAALLLAALCALFSNVLEALLLLLFAAVMAIIEAGRVANLRGDVRSRFQIPGTPKEDRMVAFMQPCRAVRQMGKHLQCDRAYFRGAPATLQSYQV